MRLIKHFSLISAMLMLLIFCSCSKGGRNLKIKISPADKSIVDLVSKTYDETQLLKIAKFEGSINEINTKYPIECLRENNSVYRVSYLWRRSRISGGKDTLYRSF